MSTSKVSITIDSALLRQLDMLVAARHFPSRSSIIQQAAREKLERLNRSRLARECAKLDPEFEMALADEGLT